MKTEYPDYLSKLTSITGDCEKPNLGISENDRNTLISQVEVIFHVAATVRFDAHLRDAVNINVRATSDLLDLAHSMKQLQVLNLYFRALKTEFQVLFEGHFSHQIKYHRYSIVRKPVFLAGLLGLNFISFLNFVEKCINECFCKFHSRFTNLEKDITEI